MTYRRRRIRIQKYQGLAEPEHNSVKASPNPDTFHRLRRRPRSTLEQPSGNARFPVTPGLFLRTQGGSHLGSEKNIEYYGVCSKVLSQNWRMIKMINVSWLWIVLHMCGLSKLGCILTFSGEMLTNLPLDLRWYVLDVTKI